MKQLKAFAALILAICLCMGGAALASQPEAPYSLGETIRDFTVATYDGRVITLSEVLKEKEAVLINIWATWCGPCRSEFPAMQEAYAEYSDRVEIIALSCESTDTDAVLADFAAKLGLTFPIAQDTVGMASLLRASSIPTTIVVDRFGTICYWGAGAMTSKDLFVRLFDAFVGEDYTASTVYDGLPPAKATAVASPEGELAAALGADAAVNPASAYVWPMTVQEKDGRTVAASTNQGQTNAAAQVDALLTASVGDAIAVTFRTSTEEVFDLLEIRLNGESVKHFGGVHDWTSYAFPVAADGTQTVSLIYQKNGGGNGGEDTVWIDSVAVLTGSEAEAALAAVPVHAAAERTALLPAAPGMREVLIDDPEGALAAAYGDAKFYVANGPSVSFTAELDASVDPERAFFFTNYDSSILPLTQSLSGGGYAMSTPIDSAETTRYVCSSVCLYPDVTGAGMQIAICFQDEGNLELFLSLMSLSTWQYADEAAPAGPLAYTVRYVDQDGSPVAGVLCQVCDESTCQVFVSDADGVCAFTLPTAVQELHTLRIPEGYEGDTDATLVPVSGEELVITLRRL